MKLIWVIPLCLATLVGPFFVARWIEEIFGFSIPSLVTLVFALSVTLSIYFYVFKDELAEAARKQGGRNGS
ncbi:MAG TPA: hypothetical protein VIT22_10100 [Pseudoxanthomonas sp.]